MIAKPTPEQTQAWYELQAALAVQTARTQRQMGAYRVIVTMRRGKKIARSLIAESSFHAWEKAMDEFGDVGRVEVAAIPRSPKLCEADLDAAQAWKAHHEPTTRRFPRSTAEAFPAERAAAVVIPTATSLWQRLVRLISKRGAA